MSRLIRAVAWTTAAITAAACGGGGGGSPAATNTPPPAPSLPAPSKQFVDATASSGIAYRTGYVNALDDRVEIWGHDLHAQEMATGGAASGDFDGDGDIDLFITRGDIGANLLYRNDGNLVFTDVAAAAGVAWTGPSNQNYRNSGPVFGDLDGDGDLDLFLGGLFGDPAAVFENNGDGTFSDVSAGAGFDALTARHTMSAALGDYDLDGDLDLLLSHWGSTVDDIDNPGDTGHLWRNDSDADGIHFTSVTETAGLSPSILTLPDPNATRSLADSTFSPNFAHIDDDAWPDIVVAADFNRSQVYLNNHDGTFRNATDVGVIDDEAGMGSTLGDYDNDGDLDWFVTAIFGDAANFSAPMTGNRLYRNDNGTFVNVTTEAGVADGGWGWGTCFLDFENDGDLDIYHTNGWSEPRGREFEADTSRAFVSNGAGTFTQQAAELGLDDSNQGRGVVCADFDADGDIDILQLLLDAPVDARLWRNDASGNNYLRVRLDGLPPNTDASGARIRIRIGSEWQMREVILGSNFLSQNPAIQVFGLGNATQVDELTVEWPGIGGAGPVTSHGPYDAGATVTIPHPDL
ncbi:MAG: CRTAC1 family protein [Gammaproteobacteria bacterium]|jgi:hypothetical protein